VGGGVGVQFDGESSGGADVHADVLVAGEESRREGGRGLGPTADEDPGRAPPGGQAVGLSPAVVAVYFLAVISVTVTVSVSSFSSQEPARWSGRGRRRVLTSFSGQYRQRRMVPAAAGMGLLIWWAR
jgi:hypothetical protein